MTTNTINNLSNTFLGFTDNLKPMQKAKVENTLDGLIRVKGKVMTEKEFVYMRLTEQKAIPEKEENYSVYSSKTRQQTKPKTVYRLNWVNVTDGEYGTYNTFNEINKTLYDYALYLISNNLLDVHNTTLFVEREQIALIASQATEAQQKENERLQREKEKQDQENYKQWLTEQANIYNSQEKIELYMSIFNEEIGECNITQAKIFLVLIDNIDNPLCRKSLKDRLHTGNPASKKIFYHITGIKLPNTDKLTMPLLETLTVNDYTGMIGYKKRKEHTLNEDQKELTTFYKFERGKGYQEYQGEHIHKYGLDMYITFENKNYSITEARSGSRMTSASTKKELLNKVKEFFDTHGQEKVYKLIEEQVNRNGLSPLYKQEETVSA